MRAIFLSYRRQDSADICDRLSDHLARRYGGEAVFRDTSAIMAGSEFPTALRQALEDCRAVVVVIGPGWLEARDARGMRRLDDPADWVRLEVATGLRDGKLIVPVLVRGASLPSANNLPEDLRPLAQCRPVILRSGPAFQQDVEAVFRALGRMVSGGPPHAGLLMCGAATLLALLALMLAPFAPALTNAEAFTVPANERLVEVAIGLEVLRAVGTRRWVWLAVPLASGALQLTAYSAGIFSLVIILFALCALPLVMGTLGPAASSRPLGTIRDQRWRFLGVAVIVASVLAFASETALWLTSLFDPSLVARDAAARDAVAQLFYPLAILSFGPLALAWVLMQIFNLLAGRWKSSIIWLFAAAAYVPVVVLMVQANIFPVFLGTFDVVLLGMGWWIVRQPLNRDSTPLRVEPLAQATSV